MEADFWTEAKGLGRREGVLGMVERQLRVRFGARGRRWTSRLPTASERTLSKIVDLVAQGAPKTELSRALDALLPGPEDGATPRSATRKRRSTR